MKDQQQEKIFTKDFINVSLTQLLVFVVFYALLTTLPIYITVYLGESQANAGLAVTFMLVSAVIIRPFSGKILDLFGKKNTLVTSVLLYTISTFFYIWFNDLLPLLALRFFHGLSFGILTTATGAIVANIVPESRKGAGMGYFALASNIAMVLGPFIGLTIIQFMSFKLMFIILNVFMVIGLICSIAVKVKEDHVPAKLNIESIKMAWNDFIEVSTIPIGFFSALVGFGYASILSFVSVHAEQLNLASSASYFFLIFAFVMIIFRPYLGRAFDEKGPKKVLIPCLLCFSLGLALLGMTTTAWMLLLAAAIVGLGNGALMPGLQTLAIQSTSRERSGYAISTFFVFYDSGIAAGSYVLGILAQSFGFDLMYHVTAIVMLLTTVILYRYLTKIEKAHLNIKQPHQTSS